MNTKSMNIAKYNALHVSDIVKYIIRPNMSFLIVSIPPTNSCHYQRSLKKDIQIRLK